jgi:hypothetical protein
MLRLLIRSCMILTLFHMNLKRGCITCGINSTMTIVINLGVGIFHGKVELTIYNVE